MATGSTGRRSRSVMWTPELRKASSRSRCSSVSKSNSVNENTFVEGRKVIRVPARSPDAPATASGASGSPSRKRMKCSSPARQMVMSSRLRERVDHRDADPVQPARHLVRDLVELTAGVELCHDDLGRRDLLLVVEVGGNAAAVVGDRHRAVAVEHHLDGVAIAGQRLVNRVVDDLVDHVVEARAVVGVADVHARPLAHGVEPTQDLDGIGVVGLDARFGGAFAHGFDIASRALIRPRSPPPPPRRTGRGRRTARRRRGRCR